MTTQIQIRRGTAAQWTAANPTLAQGELAAELDTGKFKIGNGTQTWTALAYSSGIQGEPGEVTLAGVQTLTNKTLTSPTLADSPITRAMIKDCGHAYFDSNTTNALDYTQGSVQRWAPNAGAQTLSITNWPPTGNLGDLLIMGVNLGAATITWPTINWVKNDGTFTTTFASNGVTLQASGTDFVYLWTRDAGTTIYGKVVR